MEGNSNTEPTEQLKQLVPKKNAVSVVGKHFGEDDTEKKTSNVNTA